MNRNANRPPEKPEQLSWSQLIERVGDLHQQVGRLRSLLRERERAERQARYRRIQVGMLGGMIRHCQRATDVESALGCILHDACRHLGWPAGHVYLPRPDPVQPQHMASGGLWHLDDPDRYARFREVTEQTTFQRGEGLVGRAWDQQKAIWLDDIHHDSEFKRLKIEPNLPMRAAVASPLVYYGRTLAVLEFFTERAIEPDDALLEVFNELARELGALAERKRVEQWLERSATQYYQALREAPIPLVVLDAEGTIRFWNRTAAEVFGYSERDMTGRSAVGLLAERYRPLARRYLRHGSAHRSGSWRTLVAEAVAPDGDTRPIQVAIRPTDRQDEAAYVVVAQDISTRRKLEKRMRQEHEQLRKLVVEKLRRGRSALK